MRKIDWAYLTVYVLMFCIAGLALYATFKNHGG